MAGERARGSGAESAPTSRLTTRWCKKVGEESGGSGARWKAHQRVVIRLVGRREGVGVWVPVEKDTNESQ